MADHEFDYDLFTIGAGSGGVRASRLSAMMGKKVAVAEEYRPGGTCVIRGCVPKKYMVYASGFSKSFKQARAYGWDVGEPSFDWPTFRDTMNAEVDRLSGIYSRNLANAGVELIEDRAELEGPNTIRLVNQDRTVTAKHILIAVGGAPNKDESLPGVEHTITSNELFHLPELPRHIVIAGGGYIAVEFAQVFAGLGVETCLVYRGETVLRGFDDDVRTAVHEGLKEAGVRVITHTVFEKVEQVDEDAKTKRVTLKNGDVIEDVDQVVFAIGRDPYTRGLGLETAGVEVDEKGAIKVDEYSRTSVENIYAVGDVTDRVNLTPVAIREGAAFVDTVFGGKPNAYDHSTIPSAVFTQPPVGTVGLTEAEARHQYGEVDIYKSQFRPMKGIITDHPDRMMMKMIVRPSDQVVIGVHLVGDDSPEIIQAVGIAVKAGLTKEQFDATCAVHPSVAEELVTMKEKWIPPELRAAE
ncbi:glutathione reductase [Oceanicaulis sp. HTCC2633]|uniref:glutathione-disulfide reductase n=1 Tax=Oceanicaulis sp. HTCC2633 TaxID=314254 RepID=UPI000066D5B5|nr:glutathione-disulfide reductase [Oceanicaulis sp. HTCC2633]EAP91431.1 glutathione reductase [Oceanicaulis sp. HTCC2633]